MASKHVLWAALVAGTMGTGPVWADPCGMVPPVYTGDGPAIERIGLQQTYAYHHDGVECFAIRPGYEGKVEDFGMLIPFPAPPAIRKIPDPLFTHLAEAVDPREVTIYLWELLPRPERAYSGVGGAPSDAGGLGVNQVRVLRQEAVGMYEVAVLEAGSPAALQRWMTEHGYTYPEGMDAACADYVREGWCFVAVKTRVTPTAAVAPRPGQRETRPGLPAGASFDGHVQGMAFRFESEDLVVPMRLSAFNPGETRNVVYVLTDEPVKVVGQPEEFVRRQVDGATLHRNLTEPLPARLIGPVEEAQERWVRGQDARRDPTPYVEHARALFASDLEASATGVLAHPHEEAEKELLRISEALNLRGEAIDALHEAALEEEREALVARALERVQGLTLTVIDGEFDREFLASTNLRFERYVLPAERNTPERYHAPTHGPRPAVAEGVVVREADLWAAISRMQEEGAEEEEQESEVEGWIDALGGAGHAEALEALIGSGEACVPTLLGEALEGPERVTRGWCVVALARIGGAEARAGLRRLAEDADQPELVRTWAMAGLVTSAPDVTALLEVARAFARPALARPLGRRLAAVSGGAEAVELAESLLTLIAQVPSTQSALQEPLLELGAGPLVAVMTTAPTPEVRRLAAGFAGAAPGVQAAVVEAYRFAPGAEQEAWAGGALFVPGVQWERKTARELCRSLLAWMVWADGRGRTELITQVHNNLRSLELARVAGYSSPGWQEVGVQRWLEIWGEAFGVEAVRGVLEEQGAVERYPGVLD